MADQYIPSKNINYGKQSIDDDDIEAVIKVMKGDFLTTGPAVSQFEEDVCRFVNIFYGVAVSSGTSALHCAVRALGIQEGDEIIVPAISFVASSNAILYERGIPIFVDVDPTTLNIDPSKIEEKISDKTKAIIVVHMSGQLCAMEQIREIADRHDLKIIEDGAHAIGTKDVGRYGDMTTFSFHPVKNITTGEGGMVVTNKEEYYDIMKRIRNHGINIDYGERERTGAYAYDVDFLGYNYRMTDIQASLGSSQLKKLRRYIERRKEIANIYDQAFADIDEVEPLTQKADNSYHLYIIKVKDRDRVYNEMREKKIYTNVHYKPIYLHTLYQSLGYHEGLCPEAEKVYSEILTLPIYPSLEENDQEYVIKSLKEIIAT